MNIINSFDLTQIESLCKQHVNIKDVSKLNKKIKSLIEGGSKSLQIITDFDRTLTKSSFNGIPTMSSHCIFESCPNLPESFVKESKDLCNKYYPIETSPSLTVEEKLPHMIEWWKQSEILCNGIVIEKETIDTAVAAANVQFRDGCNELLKKLNDSAVPVLVFSAGIGNVITSVLQHESLNYSNVHVISNFFKFEGSKITGYSGPAIHIFNKNQHAVENSQYFEEVKHRTNVILLGDSLGDANMAEGLPIESTVLKIGFLSGNHNDQYLPQYMDHFDVVLVNDETMQVPMDLVNCII